MAPRGFAGAATAEQGSGQNAIGFDAHASWNLPSTHQGHARSYDFLRLWTSSGTGLRILNVVDEFTRVRVGAHVGYSIGATEVRRVVEQIVDRYGRPKMIRSDNGREFTATGLLDWLRDEGVASIQVQKASPQRNKYIERFNGSMREELLNREVFHSMTEARVVTTDRVWHYNHDWPHSGREGDAGRLRDMHWRPAVDIPRGPSMAATERGGESAYHHCRWTSRRSAPGPGRPRVLSDHLDQFRGAGQSRGRQIAQFLHNNLIVDLLIALIYIMMNIIVSEIASYLDRRLGRSATKDLSAPSDDGGGR